MEIPDKILKIMALAGTEGSRPLDRLERAEPLSKGRAAIAALSEKDSGLKSSQAFPFLQSALYIYFDCFDEAHQVAQDHEGVTGNWLHAVLHRREPDAGNSKYWYTRVDLPGEVSQDLAQEALKYLGGTPMRELEAFHRKLSKSKEWEPKTFVDLCEQARKGNDSGPLTRALADIQKAEWTGLLKFILSMP